MDYESKEGKSLFPNNDYADRLLRELNGELWEAPSRV
jgi:hypothetical protein